MNKNVSLTIVAYKNYNDILNAIYSITQHTNLPIKIFIVDNSSYDNSHLEKQNFVNKISKYGNIDYIDVKENIGFGAAHNFVLSDLKSDYHIICNPDVLLVDSSIEKLVEFMEENENVGMCTPKLIDENGNLQHVYRLEPTVFDMFIRMFCPNIFPNRIKKHTMQNEDYSKPFKVPFAQGSFLIIKTGLFKELNGFDDRFFMYMEDTDLCKRVNQVSTLLYYPNAKIIHKWEKGSHKNIKLLKYHVHSMIRYFKKWGFKLF